jgi:serine/threonine protein kinase
MTSDLTIDRIGEDKADLILRLVEEHLAQDVIKSEISLSNICADDHYLYKGSQGHIKIDRNNNDIIKVFKNAGDSITENKIYIILDKGLSKLNVKNIYFPKVKKHVYRPNKSSFIQMNRIEGDTLMDYIKINGPLSNNNLIKMSSKLFTIIYILYKLKITHGDIKPDNIILKDNNPCDPYLIDFGTAEIHSGNDCRGNPTGSLSFKSPENYTANSNVDRHKSDMWSLGYNIIFAAYGYTDTIGSIKNEQSYRMKCPERLLFLKDKKKSRFVNLVCEHLTIESIKYRYGIKKVYKENSAFLDIENFEWETVKDIISKKNGISSSSNYEPEDVECNELPFFRNLSKLTLSSSARTSGDGSSLNLNISRNSGKERQLSLPIL